MKDRRIFDARDRVLAEAIKRRVATLPHLPQLRHPLELQGAPPEECKQRARAPLRDSYPVVVEIAAEPAISCPQRASGAADLFNATAPAVALNPTALSANWPNLSSGKTHRD
jgi:hypothetical protein